MDGKTLEGKILANQDQFANVFHRQRFTLYGILYASYLFLYMYVPFTVTVIFLDTAQCPKYLTIQ